MSFLLRRGRRYLAAALEDALNRRADPRIQVEMAVEEARRRHQLLTAQAASVLGNRRELEIKLGRALGEVERLRSAAGRALVLAEKERKAGDAGAATEHDRTAALFAAHLATAESAAADLASAHEGAAAAAAAARRAVERSGRLLNAKVAEASRAMTEIEAARMQERVADALESLDALAPRGGVPTLEEVRSRVDRRMALAFARTELAGESASARMLDIERAGLEEAAELKLAELRASLGLPAPQTGS